MPNIKCACFDCKWNEDDMCAYKDTLTINDCNIHTVNNGFQHFHICKGYEESEEAKEFRINFESYFG